MNLKERAKKAKLEGIEKAAELHIGPNIRAIALHESTGPHIFDTVIELGNDRQLWLRYCRDTGADSVQAEIVSMTATQHAPTVIVYRAVQHNRPEAFRPGPWVAVLSTHARIIRQQQKREARAEEVAKYEAMLIAFSPIEGGTT